MLVLEFLRRQRRLSQQSLGDATRITQIRVSLFERGLPPSPAELRALAEYLGLPEGDAGRLMLPVPDNITDIPPPPSLAETIREMNAKGRR